MSVCVSSGQLTCESLPCLAPPRLLGGLDFPHVDRVHPDGTVEKAALLTNDLGEALTFADQDIDENWERYKEAYLTGR